MDQTGASIIWAANGTDAVETVRENSLYHLYLWISECQMNGYEAAREIKKIRKEPPVIAQTAYAMKEDRQKALEAGCDEYLSKPIIGAGKFYVF
ncbi:MAG: response regulator [Bacteroidales bacterium]